MSKAILLLLFLLGISSGASAAVTEFTFTEVPQTLIPGYKIFDLSVTGTGQFTGAQILSELSGGSFYQDPSWNEPTPPDYPTLPPTPPFKYDTFVAIGSADSVPVIPGGATLLSGGPLVTFDTTTLDITWAPPGASPVNNPTDYFIGRLVIEEGSRGSIALAGLTFQQPHYFAPVVNVADLLGEIEQVPEPSTFLLVGLGIGAFTIAGMRRSRR